MAQNRFPNLNETLGDTKVFQLLILWTEPFSVTIYWKTVEQNFTMVLFAIIENISILDLALLGVKVLTEKFTVVHIPDRLPN